MIESPFAAPLPTINIRMVNDLIGSGIIQSLIPNIVKDNVEVVNFFLLLSYVLFFVSWLASTEWVEKVS